MKKKGRVKYFIILNLVLVITLVGIIAIILKVNNVSIQDLVTNLFGNHYSVEAVEMNPITEKEDSIGTDESTEAGEIESETIEEETKEPESEIAEKETKEAETEIVEDIYETITISAAGDVTLGRDSDYGYYGSFDQELELQGGDFSYFFRNVKDVFEEDDITIVNLETTLTKAKTRADKKFTFKADPSYVEILKQGSIEAVSIANNHTRDYLQEGYDETLASLEEAGVNYFGYEHKYITDIRGIKVGIMGLTPWYESDEIKEIIKKTITELRDEGADIVIAMYHWGSERNYYPNATQKNIGHFTIDSGADLVLGSHPHVLQGIEQYQGKNIVYSLGNFSFGGNKNPSDKDTMIYVHKFNFKNGDLLSEENQVIPCSISSVSNRNNYQPTILEGEEKDRVMNKILEISEPLR